MERHRFECVENGASKFWEYSQVGPEVHLTWGKIGSAGQSQTKSFDSAEKAALAAAKLVKEKTSKGYVMVTAEQVATGAAVAPPHSEPPAAAPPAPRAPSSKKAASSFESALLQKVVKKAKANELFPEDILKILSNHPSTAASTEGARALHELFVAGRLEVSNTEAVEALAILLAHQGASLDVLDPELVCRLLANASSYDRGLDGLVMLAYQKNAAPFDAVDASLPPPVQVGLDSVRARLGKSVAPHRIAALLTFLVSRGAMYLPTPTGLRNTPPEELQSHLGALAGPEMWKAAFVECFSDPRQHGGLRPDIVRLFDGADLVHVMLGNPQHLWNEQVVSTLVEMDVAPEALWSALEAAPELDEKQYGSKRRLVRGVLAALGALGFVRRGLAVPATFEQGFTAGCLYVYGWANNGGSRDSLLARFFVRALSGLGAERATALARQAMPSAVRRSADAVLAVAAYPTPELIAEAREVHGGTNPACLALLPADPASTSTTPSLPGPAASFTPVAIKAVVPRTPAFGRHLWDADPALREIGRLAVPSGEVIVCDPGLLDGGVSLAVEPGQYAVRVHTAGGQLNTAAALVANDAEPVTFEHVGSYGVDAGVSGFFDLAVHAAARDFGGNIYDDLIADPLEAHAAALVPLEGQHFSACTSGHGDGVYPVFVGRSAAGKVVVVLTTFT